MCARCATLPRRKKQLLPSALASQPELALDRTIGRRAKASSSSSPSITGYGWRLPSPCGWLQSVSAPHVWRRVRSIGYMGSVA